MTNTKTYRLLFINEDNETNMNAGELIKKLQNVAPDTEVTVTTENGTKEITDVLTNGYTFGRATLVTTD